MPYISGGEDHVLGGGRKGPKKSGRWENVVKKMWEVGDRGKKVGGGREGI